MCEPDGGPELTVQASVAEQTSASSGFELWFQSQCYQPVA